jgi:3D (Asp-Asp-Asp) domain-containing protein
MSSTISPPRLNRPGSPRRRHGGAVWLLPAGAFMLILAPVVLLAGAGNPPCATTVPLPTTDSGDGWVATAYGPPWGGIQGDGITATGLNLTTGPRAYVIAVDPTLIPLGSFEHVTPNPFGTTQAFYAGDTGGAITGHHVDIYDWHGRVAQDAWGKRSVTVEAAPKPGTGNLLDEITPTNSAATNATNTTGGCATAPTVLALTAAQTATILPDGQATAPASAPAAVKQAIAAGNQIIDKPYLWGGGHGQPLTELAAGYDCSGAASYVLHTAGLFGDYAEDATQLESYGASGAGQWMTVYANSAHAFIDIAGVVLDTAHYAATTPAGSGPRWQPQTIIAAQYAGDEADGHGGFIQRHPEGL